MWLNMCMSVVFVLMMCETPLLHVLVCTCVCCYPVMCPSSYPISLKSSAAAVPDTPSSLPMAPSFSPRCTPLPFRKLLCQDICDTVGSNVSIPLFSPSPRPVEVSKRDGQAFRSGDQADISGDQMGGPKSRKVLVFPEAAASDHKGEDLNKPASHEKQNEACDLVLLSCDITSESRDCPASLSDGNNKVHVQKVGDKLVRNCTLKLKAEYLSREELVTI